MSNQTVLVVFFVLLFIFSPADTGAAEAIVLDSTHLKNYFHDKVPASMKEMNIPGAAVVVVKDAQIIYAEGYGFSNQAKRTPVDVNKTIFRIGSVTKTFTAIAVLQLVEAGKLRLDEDANRFLKIGSVDPSISGPVAIRSLLTHAGGIEEKLIYTAVHTQKEVLPLGIFLQREMPLRFMPADRLMSYSNHGYTLLGYIAERVSGQTFGRYLQTHIFDPLQMKHSSYDSLPNQNPDFAAGYENGHAVEPAYVLIGPAAAITATPADLAHFMIALLNGGKFGGALLASSSTIRLLLERQFSNDPRLIGMSYGLFESNYNNQISFYHEGGIRGYSALMYLFPADRTGLFIVNNGNSQSFHWRLCDDFLNHFYAAKPNIPRPHSSALSHAKKLQGQYQFFRYSRSTIEKLALLKRPAIQVRALPDGYLSIGGTRFVEIGRLLYQEADSYEQAAFIQDSRGRIAYLSIDQDVLERMPWYRSSTFHQILLFVFLTGFIGSRFGWDSKSKLLSLSEGQSNDPPPAALPVRLLKIVSLLNLLFLISLVAIMLATKPGTIWYGVSPLYYVVLTIPLISAVLTSFLIFQFLNRRHIATALGMRARFIALLILHVSFLFFLHHWNLIGYRF